MTPPGTRPRRPAAWVPAIVVALLLLVGAGVHAVDALPRWSWSFGEGPDPAEVLPAQAVHYSQAALMPEAQQQELVDAYADRLPPSLTRLIPGPEERVPPTEVLGQWEPEWERGEILEAVEPWAGEVMGLAVWRHDARDLGADSSPFMSGIVLHTTDPTEARTALDRLRQRSSAPFVHTAVDDFVLLADTDTVLTDWLAALDEEGSLAEADAFTADREEHDPAPIMTWTDWGRWWAEREESPWRLLQDGLFLPSGLVATPGLGSADPALAELWLHLVPEFVYMIPLVKMQDLLTGHTPLMLPLLPMYGAYHVEMRTVGLADLHEGTVVLTSGLHGSSAALPGDLVQDTSGGEMLGLLPDDAVFAVGSQGFAEHIDVLWPFLEEEDEWRAENLTQRFASAGAVPTELDAVLGGTVAVGAGDLVSIRLASAHFRGQNMTEEPGTEIVVEYRAGGADPLAVRDYLEGLGGFGVRTAPVVEEDAGQVIARFGEQSAGELGDTSGYQAVVPDPAQAHWAFFADLDAMTADAHAASFQDFRLEGEGWGVLGLSGAFPDGQADMITELRWAPGIAGH